MNRTPKDRLRMPAARRLRNRRDFNRIFEVRCSTADEHLVVYCGPNDRQYPRMAVSVSKAIGNAVVRNRTKRLIREAYRLEQPAAKSGCDFLFVARRSGSPSLQQFRASIRNLVVRVVDRLSGQVRKG